jgi:curved DNA-binding protein CbpA/ActR/RegA family two-component response regulator
LDKSEIRVFIVEDDATLAGALAEAVKQLGFRPVVCLTPTEAQNQFRIQGAGFFYIDCMLPKMSGIDLSVALKADGAADIPTLLASGIYRDKTFIKDALLKTGAVGFLTKPFDVKDFQKILTEKLSHLADEDLTPLETMLVTPSSPGEKVKLINQLGEIEAFDIPWLCSMLMNPAISGILELKNESEKAAISFSQGSIVQVEMQNPASYFGALLIENGYLEPEQLEQALAMNSPKRVGERLVDMNLLSPHVIDLINAEQTAIRLSRLITDTSFSAKFVAKDIASNASSLVPETLAPFLVDWINSKIQPSWLKQRYLKWMNSPCVKVPHATPIRRLWNIAPLKNFSELISEFEKGASLAQTLSKGNYKEDVVFQVLHLLIITEYLKITRETKAIDETAQTNRLRKIWADMQTQDFFALLGLSRNAKPADIKKAYHELAKIFHPDKIPISASQELKTLAQQVFGQMTKAYETLSHEQKKSVYLKELEMGKAEKILEAEALFEEGKVLLKSGQTQKARDKFESAALLRPLTSEILIHLAWARIQSMGSTGNSEEGMMEVEATLNKIPPEDRHNFTYYFVKGLFQSLLGEDAPARNNLQHALSLNPKFIEAERALRLIDLKKNKPKDLLHGDLKDVVTGLFKRPK